MKYSFFHTKLYLLNVSHTKWLHSKIQINIVLVFLGTFDHKKLKHSLLLPLLFWSLTWQSGSWQTGAGERREGWAGAPQNLQVVDATDPRERWLSPLSSSMAFRVVESAKASNQKSFVRPQPSWRSTWCKNVWMKNEWLKMNESRVMKQVSKTFYSLVLFCNACVVSSWKKVL